MPTDHLLLYKDLHRAPSPVEMDDNLEYLEDKVESTTASAAAALASKTAAEAAKVASEVAAADANQDKLDAATSAAQALAAKTIAEQKANEATETVGGLNGIRPDLLSTADNKGADMVAYGAGTVKDALDGQASALGLRLLAADLLSSNLVLGDALMTVQQPYTNAVARTQHQKNSDLFTGLDAGMIGDGVVDDLAALTAVAASFPGPILLPAGKQYNLGGGVAVRGSHTLWDNLPSGETPYDTDRIHRIVDAVGDTSIQTGAQITRVVIGAGVGHHEFGQFNILESRSTLGSLEHVAQYNQISSLGAGASPIWGGVDEVKNVQPDGTGTSVDHVLCGREIDVVNKFPFSDTLKKIGLEVVAWGGGESTEAFSVYAANNVRGNGSYGSGHFRYGFRILGNAIDGTNGVGLQVLSTHGTGIQIVGASTNYAIHLNADALSPVGINIGANYSTAIAITADKSIKLNGTGGTQGIRYDSASGAILLDAAAIGVTNHTNYNSATAGGVQTVPASVTGYIGVYINGFLKKIPYFNS